MIKRSLIFCLVLMILHSCFILINPGMGRSTHQWQENTIKAQNFLYTNKNDIVLVGSSLSARIIPDSIPSISSIAFSGCSVEDGLRIIKIKNVAPKHLLIETNFFMREPNFNLINSTTSGIMPYIRKYVPSLQERNAPICLFFSLIETDSEQTETDTNLLKHQIENRISDDFILPETELSQRMNTLKELISNFESQGTQVHFYEMPMNKRILDLNRHKQTRKAVHKYFPENKYHYLPTDTQTYLTNDGEHLSVNESQQYSHFFTNAVKSSISSQNTFR